MGGLEQTLSCLVRMIVLCAMMEFQQTCVSQPLTLTNYESACTDSVYRDGSVIVFKSDTGLAGWFRTQPKLTTQTMEWGKNCAYVGHVTPDDVEWFRMSPKDSNDNFELKAVDLGDRKVDELYAELWEFLRIRESL